MKKILFLIILIFNSLFSSAQSWNPYVSQGIISPAPLLPYQFNGTGVISFNIGNSGSNQLLYYPSNPNNNLKVVITLSRGLPNVTPLNPATALTALGGSWVNMFNWQYDMGLNKYTGTQNQTIEGMSQGNITVQYKVTQNSTQGSPQNGFLSVLIPPPYTSASNSTNDDMVSAYTFTYARDFGDAPISYGSAYHVIDFDYYYCYMGTLIDNDTAYQPSGDASADDNTGIDDEDGVTFPALIQGFPATIQVSVYNFGFLYSWIDWNGDGDFGDAGETLPPKYFFDNGPGIITISLTVPSNANTSIPVFARFRYGANGVSSSGPAPWGEVEDYMVTISSLTISGTVFDDANGMTNNLVDGTGTNASGNIFMNLVKNTDNTVLASLLVNSNGTYSFGTSAGVVPSTVYNLIITSSSQAIGSTLTTATFPVNWVPTGEKLGTGTGNDGIVDGKLTITTTSGAVTSANFGLDQLPNSNNASGGYSNPGGNQQVVCPILTGSDPEDGALGPGSTLVITSLAANGTLFYNSLAVTLNQVITGYNASLLTVDPVNGAPVVTFTFAFQDAAGKQDPSPATATMTFIDLTVAGNVFDDANGMFDNLVNGTGTNASGYIYMNLVDIANDLVLFSTAVSSNGTFIFGTSGGIIINTSYRLIISSSLQNPGTVLTQASFPENWVPTGEILGTGAGNDGIVDGTLTITVGTGNVTNANFGLDQLPESNNASATYTNPGGANEVFVPTLTGSDPEEGTLGYGDAIVITLLPTNGILYYNASPVVLNQVITDYDPVKLTVDPANGPQTVIFEYAFQDMAFQQDPTPATVTLIFNDLTISGNVYNDGNGMNNGFVDGTGTNASGMMHVNLVNNSNNLVVASLPAGNDGLYSFGTADGTLNLTSYVLILTNSIQNPGITLISASFPENWVPTGENLGAGQGNDGMTDGKLAVNTNTGSVSEANFGLDQLPQANDITGSHLNPGGNNTMVVPTLSGSDPEDGLLGPGNTFIITSLAANGTLYYQGIPVVVNQVITDYVNEQLTLDPIDGTPVVTFTYNVFDSAGFQAPAPGTITISFTLIPYADLSVTKTDSSDHFTVGKDIVYTMVVRNAWNDAANGAKVTDITPTGTTMSWSAVFSGGATGNEGGTGDIDETVNMPGGAKITYKVTVTVPCNFTANIVNIARVRGPEGITDPDTTNNSATDTDTQNIWTGAVNNNWNVAGNWTLGVPDTAGHTGAAIPSGLSNYPVIYDNGISTATLVIAGGATLTIEPGKDLYVAGCSAINGPDALYLKSDKTNGNASFITSQGGTIYYPNNGSVRVDLFLEKCPYSGDCSYYVSSPLSDALTGVFSGDSLRRYNEVTGTFGPFITTTTEPLNVMEGYMLSNSADETRIFSGKLNDSTVTKTLTRTPGKGNGWNLVGNPYPSCINLFTMPDWSNIDKVVYPYDHISGNYKPFPISVGFGLSYQYIPSMSGFFVHVNSDKSSGTLRFSDENRCGVRTQTSRIELTENLIWLKTEGNGAMYDEAIIYFRNDANTGYDQDIDCYKLEGAATAPQLSSISSDDISLAINALPVDSLDQNIIVPMEFYIPSKKSGEYSITASKIESFTGGTNIWLEDKKADTMVFLNNNPVYNFSYFGNDDPARFFLHFHYPHFGIDDKSASEKIQIYSYQNVVYIRDLAGRDLKGQLRLYNIIGQKVTRRSLTGGAMNKFSLTLPEGYYVVEVLDNGRVIHGKIYLTR